MNFEIKTTDLAEIKVIAEQQLELADNAENVADKAKFESNLEEAVAYFASVSKAQCYAALRKAEDPMKAAILQFNYPTIKVKEVRDKDTKNITRSIVDAEKPIDLGDLYKRFEGIGADPKWIYTAEKFNYHLTIRAAERVNATIKNDSFYMNQIAKEIDLGKNPCSNTQLLKTLNIVIGQMIGEEFKGNSHDVNYLIDVYANDNKKSKTGITAANHKTLRNYLKKVCYRILTGRTGYDVDQREIKEAK